MKSRSILDLDLRAFGQHLLGVELFSAHAKNQLGCDTPAQIKFDAVSHPQISVQILINQFCVENKPAEQS